MSKYGLRVFALISLFPLLAACQPIQPEAPTAPLAAATEVPALVETNFPIAGVTVGVPEEWLYWFEPVEKELILTSGPLVLEPQSGGGFWPYLAAEPYAVIHFAAGTMFRSTDDSILPELLLIRFATAGSSAYAINPVRPTKVVEEPVMLEINGQPAARAVVEGWDTVLSEKFRAHVWAIRNGERVMYVSAALLDANEAQFASLVSDIVETVEVGEAVTIHGGVPVATAEIAPGQVVTGTLGVTQPDEVLRHYVHFEGKAGKRYLATLSPLDPYLDIVGDAVDASGKSMLYHEYDEAGANEPEKFGVTAPEDGDYYIVVRSWYLMPGPYRVELQQLN